MMYSAEIHSTWLFFKEKPHRSPPAPLHLYEKCSSNAAAWMCDLPGLNGETWGTRLVILRYAQDELCGLAMRSLY
jgi:hypothetical protein